MNEQERAGCHQDCGAVATERNRYFTGKNMTARDFQADQEYFLGRHRLHNRLLHGWGIVCGLAVECHPDKNCPDWLVVRGGIALDCCGRELILSCDKPLKVPREDCGGRPQVLCARYVEREIEHLPVLFHEGGCGGPAEREANRVRECVELEFVDEDELDPRCWLKPRGGEETPCCDEEEDAVRGCLEPSCPCGDRVPLARITFKGDDFDIDLDGRRLLPPPRDYLTRITGINWKHGGSLSLADLKERCGRLEVRFDRRLLRARRDATGVNRFTFVVQYGGIQRDLEFLPFDPDNPPGLAEDDECVARFTIDPDYIDGRRNRSNIAGNVVYVALKCDFILDRHGNPVSGAHLRGRLPNDGAAPGGIFESWFRVTAKEEDAS